MSDLFTNFNNHLATNSRILFSAPFGLGKTHFIKDFFGSSKTETNHSLYKSQYVAFHLFPVNYHVASNEDIVKLLKYDILKMLIAKKYVNFENKEVRKFVKASFNFGYKKLSKILISGALTTGKSVIEKTTGVDVKELYQESGLKDLIKNLQEEVEKTEVDKNKVENYISEIQNEWFAFDEDEFLTKFIREVLRQNKKEDKDFVLIIDDLERLDPDHIFRILNIFSAFQDNHNETENLFGFDKIMVVTDIDNLQSIYHHKYGDNTDFEGYIDKFYQNEIFEFGNDLLRYERFLLERIIFNNNNRNQVIISIGIINCDIYTYIIYKMIEYKIFTYRMYKKQIGPVEGGKVSPNSEYFYSFSDLIYSEKYINKEVNNTSIKFSNYDIKLNFIADMLNFHFSTKKSLIKAIKTLAKKDTTKLDSRSVWIDPKPRDHFLHLLLINHYKNMETLNKESPVFYIDRNDSQKAKPLGYREGSPIELEKYESKFNNIKPIHSFSDIWQLFLDYLEGENS